MLLTVPVSADSEAPLYWRREFRGRPDQVRVVRAFAAHLLDGFPALDDVLLVLDELVVNALRHTRSGRDGGCFTVGLRWEEDGVTAWVSDEGGPGKPGVRQPADPEAIDELPECGRGLLTVDALVTQWSWTGDVRGRTVRACFSHDQD
ncbi:ATP-binding protein [Actinomadura rugatobispora]|uniref:ATP-binding protein n=1 Tax=Actinomadura rugatobispora TaxID=1994 RepID=A0ABW1AGI2_9ACTN|nr:hypothetical protein GCM10010200_025200 [Actinomadura rugatobispora]